MTARSPSNPPPQGNQPPGDGGNSGNGGDPPEPPHGPPPAQPGDDPHNLRHHNARNPPSEPEEETTRSEDIPMRPGTTRILLLVLILIGLAILAGLFGKGCMGCSGCSALLPAMAPPAATSASSGAAPAPPPTNDYEKTFAVPSDLQFLCVGPAAENYFMVGRANGTTEPVISAACQGGSEFVGYPANKARILPGDNLVVSKSQALSTLYGNAMSYIGSDNNPGAQTAKAFFPLSHWVPGKNRVRIRIDGGLVTLEDPLLVLTGQNGGDPFDAICAPYKEMKTPPSDPWALEIWSRCRRGKTPTNVATTQTIVKYVQANPGVSRDDFQTATAKIAKLEEQVAAGGNKVIPPQKVDTGVGGN